jgi:DNA invertase Pin-like site-specific DNA recombinase
MTTFIYARFSSEAQARGDSLRRQIDGAKDYAAKMGLQIVEDQNIIVDEAASASVGENIVNGNLGEFLKKVKADQIPRPSDFIVQSQDRLTREGIDSNHEILKAFRVAGINIHCWAENHIFRHDKYDLNDHIRAGITSATANDEIVRKTLNVRQALANKRANAKTQPFTLKCPGWIDSYYQCPKCQGKNVRRMDNKRFACRDCNAVEASFPLRYELNKDHTKTVQQIFQMCVEGVGAPAIAIKLNQKGISPFGKAKRGWQQSSIQKILTARTTIGEYQPHFFPNGVKRSKRAPVGEPIPNYYPKVIAEDLFNRAQRALDQRSIKDKDGKKIGRGGRKGETVSNLFSHLIACAYCGSPMRYVNKGHKSHAYLMCSGAIRGLGCEKTGWRYKEFETDCLHFFRELDLPSIFKNGEQEQARAKLQQEIDACEGRILALKKKRDKLFKMLSDDDKDEYVATTYKEVKQDLKDEEAFKETKQRELSALATRTVDFKETQDIIKKLQSTNGGDDVYRLRAQVASKLKSVADKIVVAAAGSAPFDPKTIKARYVVGEEAADGMELPWFAIFLRDVEETQIYGAPGTVIVSTYK